MHYIIIVTGENIEEQLQPFSFYETPEDGDFYTGLLSWDWYVIGGRWTGYFPLLPGKIPVVGVPVFDNTPTEGCGDIVRKKDVDWVRYAEEWVLPAGFIHNGKAVENNEWEGRDDQKKRDELRQKYEADFWDMLHSLDPDTLLTAIDIYPNSSPPYSRHWTKNKDE